MQAVAPAVAEAADASSLALAEVAGCEAAAEGGAASYPLPDQAQVCTGHALGHASHLQDALVAALLVEGGWAAAWPRDPGRQTCTLPCHPTPAWVEVAAARGWAAAARGACRVHGLRLHRGHLGRGPKGDHRAHADHRGEEGPCKNNHAKRMSMQDSACVRNKGVL